MTVTAAQAADRTRLTGRLPLFFTPPCIRHGMFFGLLRPIFGFGPQVLEFPENKLKYYFHITMKVIDNKR